MWLISLALLVAFVLWFLIEPRMVWPGFLLLFALLGLAAATLATLLTVFSIYPALNQLARFLSFAVMLFALLIGFSPVLVGVFLLANFVIMWRKEGLGARLTKLSGLCGAASLLYFAWVALNIKIDNIYLISLAISSAFPLIALAMGFIAFVLYAGFYQWFFKRFGGPVEAVIVLGASIADGKVTPLLAGRVDQGISLLSRAANPQGQIPLLMSGGQGDDEAVPESTAMAEYAVEQGVPAQLVWQENQSATTEENMRLSKQILTNAGITGKVAVATNDYHAFRSATMMRAAGLPGYVIGYRTARYFWPSAMIREYVALLRDHFWFVVAMLGLSLFPLVAVIIGILLER